MKVKERKAKERKAKEYCDNHLVSDYKQNEDAFKAGWEAALDYFSSLPFDKMMEAFDEWFKSKEGKK